MSRSNKYGHISRAQKGSKGWRWAIVGLVCLWDYRLYWPWKLVENEKILTGWVISKAMAFMWAAGMTRGTKSIIMTWIKVRHQQDFSSRELQRGLGSKLGMGAITGALTLLERHNVIRIHHVACLSA